MTEQRDPNANRRQSLLLDYARHSTEALSLPMPESRRTRLQRAVDSTLAILEAEMLRGGSMALVTTSIIRPDHLVTDIAALVETKALQTGQSTAWQSDRLLPTRLATPAAGLTLAALSVCDHALSHCQSGVLMVSLSGLSVTDRSRLSLTLTLSAGDVLTDSLLKPLPHAADELAQIGGTLETDALSLQDYRWTLTVPARRTEHSGSATLRQVQSRFDLTEDGPCLIIAPPPLGSTLSSILRGCGLDCLTYQDDLAPDEITDPSMILIDQTIIHTLQSDWISAFHNLGKRCPLILLTNETPDYQTLPLDPSSIAPRTPSASELIAILDTEALTRKTARQALDDL